MGKKQKRLLCQGDLMQSWPKGEDITVSYESLISPIKKIFFEGYELKRKAIKNFLYRGFNIGAIDQKYYPTPSERFSARWLENEEKFNRTLLDNIFCVVFQLGIEQGRRLSFSNLYENSLLCDIIKARTKTIKDLQERLSAYEPQFNDTDLFLDAESEEDHNEDLRIDFEEEIDPVGNVETSKAKED